MTDHTTIHPSSQPMAHLIDLIVFKGAPQNQDAQRPIQILVNHGFVVGYCAERLQPAWTAYRVALATRDVKYDRPHLYYDDPRLAAAERIGPQTFGKKNNIAYHVGHMVPNEVINLQFGRLAQMETFFMSNMSPQRGTLNTGVWAKLENAIRNIENTSERDHVWCIVGPIFGDDPDTLDRAGGKKVPIPDAYFCITVDPFRYPWDRRSNVDVVAFRIEQDEDKWTPLDELVVDVATIEAQTNLRFFPNWGGAGPAAAGAAAAAGAHDPARVASRHRILRQLGGN
jgi:DNA/RNA endonuclease G (NUC1)